MITSHQSPSDYIKGKAAKTKDELYKEVLGKPYNTQEKYRVHKEDQRFFCNGDLPINYIRGKNQKQIKQNWGDACMGKGHRGFDGGKKYTCRQKANDNIYGIDASRNRWKVEYF